MKKRIIALLIAVAVLFTFTACGKPKRESAQDVMTRALEAVKALDSVKMKEIFGTEGPAQSFDDLDAETQTMLKLCVKNLTYNIISSEENEDTATVKIEITNTDMVTVLTDATSQLVGKIVTYMAANNNAQPSDEEAHAMLGEILEGYMPRDDLAKVTNTEEFTLKLSEEGKWQPEITTGQFDTLFGGLYTFQQQQSES